MNPAPPTSPAPRPPRALLLPGDGPRAVAVPGSLKAWCETLARFGTMSLADVMQPAIKFAARGFAATPYLHECIVDGAEVTLGGAASKLPEFTESTGGRKLYTYLGSDAKLYETVNEVVVTNTSLEASMDLAGAGDPECLGWIGRLMAEAMVKAQPKGNWALIEGDPLMPIVDLFRAGQMQVVQHRRNRGVAQT